MAEGKIPGVRNVSKNAARKLLQLPCVADEALSTFGPAHVLPDGHVLQYMPGDLYGTLYPSREAIEEMNRRLAETERAAAEQQAAGYPDPCLKLLPPVDDFIRDVDMHAKSLGRTIKVADDALDRSFESLDAVDKAMKRIPWAKRPVPEILTPLVAYVGEVMRRLSGGRWSKRPETEKSRVYVCDPEELLARYAAWRKLQPVAIAAADKAAAEAKARGASAQDVQVAWNRARQAIHEQLGAPKSQRLVVREENEPMITTGNGQLCQPFAVVYLPMIDPSKRIPTCSGVSAILTVHGYRPAFKPSPA